MAATDSTVRVDCRICGTPFEYQRVPGPGRLRRFCSEACKFGSEAQRLSVVAECATCGSGFSPRYRHQKVCSLECRRAPAFIGPRNKRKSKPPLREVACCGCGITTLRRMRADEAGRYCSQACNTGSMARVAAEVAALYRISGNVRRVSPSTYRRMSALVKAEKLALRRIARYVERAATVTLPCGCCGTEITVLRHRGSGGHRRLCHPCRAESDRKARRVARSRRRARVRALPNDPIDPMVVFERDGWRCYLCGVATPRFLRGTLEPNAPELEHRLALANGGAHTWDNVACSCRACNGAKGARLAA